jgi:O-antigen ligase
VLYLTGSRGAWAAVAVGCLYVLALNRRWGWPVAVACLVVAGAAAAVGGARLARALNSGHTNTATQRLHVWSSSLRMIRDHPILGVGPDNFLHYYAPTTGPYLPCAHGLGYMESAASREPCLSHPHDEILDFWLSTGVAGLVAFLWLEVTFWRGALYAWRVCPAPGARPIMAGAMAVMAASLAHGLVDNSYFLIDLSVAFWLLCAMVSFFGAGRDRRVAGQG